MHKAAIILGAGPEQLDAYKTCISKKLITIGVDKNKKALAVKFSKIFVNRSIYDYQSIINILEFNKSSFKRFSKLTFLIFKFL